MSKILAIGDIHLHADHSNERMDWLGRLIADEEPDNVVQVGDMEDMPSLSKYDIGKRSSHGHTYERDINAVLDGQERLFSAFKKAKRKKYNPKWDLLGGNHGEGRMKRAANEDPKLYGTITIEDCLYEEYGWTYHPYMKIVNIEGILWTHHFTDGAMDRPIGGKTFGNSLVTKKGKEISMLQGHIHIYDIVQRTSMTGKRIVAGSVGCYFDFPMDYVSQNCQDEWARGVLLLKNVEDGNVRDFEWISMETIKEKYA